MKKSEVHLTQLASAAGCGAKIGPKVLAQVVGKLPKFTDPMLLVGPETSDDAAVYKINDELAMIHTVDFFPPVVDDPYMYGQIAAANALSDVYAMGGVPKLALNVVAFPNCLGPEVLEQILRGGADKVMEAGAVLAGGHTINDKEPKYGLCVTGYVHPDKMWKNYGAEEGDILILTKPLGCGILNTAIKAEMASQEEIERVQKIMAKLNKYAAEIASKYTIHSCTDVTGFSLAGHSLEMAKGSRKTLVIQSEKLPIIEGVEEYAQMGLIPEGAYRNRDFAGDEVRSEIKELWMEDLVFDPQTSGGLLLAVPAEEANALAEELAGMDIFGGVIGYVTELQDKAVVFAFDIHPRYAEKTLPVRLQGLDADKMYRVKEINLMPGANSSLSGNGEVFSGEFLMNVGLNLFTTQQLNSRVIEVVAE